MVRISGGSIDWAVWPCCLLLNRARSGASGCATMRIVLRQISRQFPLGPSKNTA